MKHKIIETNKSLLLVVDLPDDDDYEIGYDYSEERVFIQYHSDDFRGMPNYERYYLDKGNWQPLTMDEETANKIVDKKIVEGILLYTISEERYRMTALDSLQSLIDANVQRVNPYQKPRPFPRGEHLTKEEVEWANKIHEMALVRWEEIEANVFHNPFFWYKLK